MQNIQQNRLYGRTRGRSKKKINIKNYLELLNFYKFSTYETNKSYILDIGTGYGETSIFLSKKYNKDIIISCEKYIDGNLNLLKIIKKEKIHNIKIHNGNALDILDRNSKNLFFNLVWIFFPDPWPKNKHHKRRLITDQFLIKIHSFLKNNGKIVIATDSASYLRFILNSIYLSKNYYEWINQNTTHLSLKDYYDLETKFYKKAIISGRNPSLFILKKI